MAAVALAVAFALSASGCYTFTSVQGTPAIGSEVRATMSDEEALNASAQTGDLTRILDGELVEQHGDSIVISVVTFRSVSEISGTRQMRQSVTLSRSGLLDLELRELSTWRTGLTAGVTAVVAALAANQVITGGSDEDPDDPGDVIGALVPLIRISLGR